jgi:hypothetical protein
MIFQHTGDERFVGSARNGSRSWSTSHETAALDVINSVVASLGFTSDAVQRALDAAVRRGDSEPVVISKDRATFLVAANSRRRKHSWCSADISNERDLIMRLRAEGFHPTDIGDALDRIHPNTGGQ